MADTIKDFLIESDSPVNWELMFWNIVGHEGLCRPSLYELTVLSEIRQINPNDILGRVFKVSVHFEDDKNVMHHRHYQGHAVRFVRGGQVGSRYVQYHISLRSWFWLLTHRTNSRIHQEKTVLEVADAVFEDSPIKRFKKTNVDNVTGNHKPRRYSVQHAQSDYQFLSHLMEEEGVYYWFDGHDKPGTMYLSDSSDIAHEALPAQGTLRYTRDGLGNARFNEIVRWVSSDRLDTGHHAGSDSNFKTIRKKIGATINAAAEHDLADFEMFESPAGYFNSEDAEASSKIRGDELAARRERHWAVTGWPDVAVGRTFKFEGDPDGVCDGEYLIAGCTFVLSHPGYEGVNSNATTESILKVLHEALNDDAINAHTLDTLKHIIETTPTLRTGIRGTSSFLLTVIPADLPYRPARLTPGAVMPGPQSAIVVGAEGKEIDVDDFGRVKVQFHWDRYGTKDDKSTAWVRVSQPWAGRGWGGYFTPRIGQEVIVDFLNGDPDRPVITGRLYNDEQPIPYKASGTQSGFKTRSTPGGTPAHYNEIMFEDKKGAENINIHAERNMSRSVEADDSTTVGHDQSLTVDNDRTALVRGVEKWTVEKDQFTAVVLNQTNRVNLMQTNTVGVTQINFVGEGGQTFTVLGPQVTNLVGGQTTTVTGDQSLSVDGHQTIGVTGGQETAVTGDTKTTSTGELKIHAGSRKDLADGAFSIMANDIKVVSNTNIAMMAVGNIDATSIGSNTTVLGSNSSGYIGMNSDVTIGMNRSTFMGLSIDNALAIAISNFGGLQIENTLGLKLIGVASPEITAVAISMEVEALKTFSPGAGAGAAAGAAVAGVLGAVAGAVTAFTDIKATLKQYEDAQLALEAAAQEAQDEGMPGLAGRLSSLSRVAARRKSDAFANAIPGATAITEGSGISALRPAAIRSTDALAGANPTTAGPSSSGGS
jgi:type VI secretion system secreted protein VgrG